MTFLEAAEAVLRSGKEPLSPEEIVRRARESGLLETKGKTPSQTMKSKLSTDILRRGDRSRFLRTSAGRFGLREWKDTLGEYVAPRYQRALLDEDVLVFDRTSLGRYIPGPGLFTEPVDSDGLIQELRPMRRRAAEDDPSVIQLVSVFVVKFKDAFLTYKRSKRLPEQRLHGEYSIAFGGHLNPEDIGGTLLNIFVPELGLAFLLRELEEELRLPSRPDIQYRGLLYDDSRELSAQHLGLVYDVEMRDPTYEIGERGFLIDPKLETREQILGRIGDFENWSVLLLMATRAEDPSQVNG